MKLRLDEPDRALATILGIALVILLLMFALVP
jgi:hypothetical protein